MIFPKISIVTSNYNQAEYLEHAIVSILNQGYPNLEYIIIDGGSTDNSIEVIKKYEDRICYWVSEKDKGVCDAVNKGLKISTGEIMACINSDDMMHKNSLFIIGEIFSNYPEISWLLGASTIFDEKGRTVFVKQSKGFTKYHFLLREFEWIQLESTFWRRSLWEKAGSYLNQNIKYACDFDLWMRFFHFSKLYITDGLIGGFRTRTSGQLSVVNAVAYMKEVEEILEDQKWEPTTLHTLERLKKLRKKMFILEKWKFFNHTSLQYRLKKKFEGLIDSAPRLHFDSNSQTFIQP